MVQFEMLGEYENPYDKKGSDVLEYLSWHRTGSNALKYHFSDEHGSTTMDFNEEQTAAIGDFLNAFVRCDDGETLKVDTDKLIQAINFIAERY